MSQNKQIQPKFLSAIPSKPNNSSTGGNPFETDDEEEEIFSKLKLPLRLPSNFADAHIEHLIVCKNWLLCVLATQEKLTLLRFFLPRAIPPGEVALDKYTSGYKIGKLFLDRTGHHVIISLVPKATGVSADFLYIHCSETPKAQQLKVRRIEKFKDHEITAVAFNTYYGDETTTGTILFGTSRGLIFETELGASIDMPRKQLYDLCQSRITGLEILRVPNSNRWIVVASTPDGIHAFQDVLRPEERSLHSIFSSYGAFAEKQKTDLNYSLLRFFAPPNSKYPKQWAWLSGAGLRTGELSIDIGSTATLLGDTLIKLDFEKGKLLSFDERRTSVVKSFVLTEYHAVLLYADHIKAICLLNQELVYHEVFDESRLGKLQNIERDAFTGTIYVYTDRIVFTLRITREERNIWRIYLDRGQYELATAHAASNADNLQMVLTQRANAAFREGAFEVAANYYAETEESFEAICLKFMALNDKRPIVNYVKKRLTRLTMSEDSTPEAIKSLIIWLIDLYLIQINLPEQSEARRHEWQAEYDEFMREPYVLSCTSQHRNAVQQLITQHADSHNLAQFAISICDFEQVIGQQLKASRYAEALQTLAKQTDLSLYYKYAPKLIEHLPKATVEALMAMGSKLDLEKLVPTLIIMDTADQRKHVIRYLEFAVYKLNSSNEIIHNFLLHLYAQYEPKLLMKYLEIQGRDDTLVHYDIHYALKVCTELDVKDACVFLQCLLCMWTTAVDLALQFDMQLAKETASKPQDTTMRRKLWLRIAYHDIKGTNDVKRALNLLKECDLLRIEDLLPFFSDFEKIDNFKEAICDALKDYNQRIQELQREMAETREQSLNVTKELRTLRTHNVRLQANEVCDICDMTLLVKPFFIFICGHKYHSDCLEKQLVPMLSKDRSRLLSMLKQQLEAVMTQPTTSKAAEPEKDRLDIKAEIENILASDCLYCSHMIETIDQPFVDDWDQVNVEWE
ncbi:vacuolar protein sorting-associated protein 18 homolog [Drosophila busckii]|nr:vacuolar protein sorting-associated protein 18 homolog [Drosophila busckii]